MAVLVTGAAGHIGSNVARTLLEHGYDVVCFDASIPPPFSVIHPARDRVHYETGSVLDLARILNLVKQYDVDAIVHLAAIMGGATSRPLETVKVNVEGTANVLEAGRILGLRRVICTSSYGAAASYGLDQTQTIAEDQYVVPVSEHDMNPPYGSTKAMGEELTCVYRRCYDVDAAIIRPAMVYGPGYPPGRGQRHPMEALVHAAAKGIPVKSPTGRDSVIDSTYVKDTALGYLRLLEADDLPNWLYNISSGRVFSTGDMIDAVQKAFPDASFDIGPGGWCGIDGQGPPYSPIRPASDIERARKDLGYEPQFADLEVAAADYAGWLRDQAY
jgi:nucleoside-diphosphate-sugar epimerase